MLPYPIKAGNRPMHIPDELIPMTPEAPIPHYSSNTKVKDTRWYRIPGEIDQG
jgi:hypothetical protein